MTSTSLRPFICLGVLFGSLWLPGRSPAQTLQFTNVQLQANREATLMLSAPVGRSYRIEAATNVNFWNALVTFPTNSSSALQYTDSAPPFLPARYYRATQLTGTNILSGEHLSLPEISNQCRNSAH